MDAADTRIYFFAIRLALHWQFEGCHLWSLAKAGLPLGLGTHSLLEYGYQQNELSVLVHVSNCVYAVTLLDYYPIPWSAALFSPCPP